MSLKVLVADDDQLVCNFISNLLEEFNELTVVAKTTCSNTIFDLVGCFKPDIVFTDINMPDLDGLSLVHGLKLEYPEIGVVFISGHSQFAAEAFNLDVVDFVVKPISRERMIITLEKILRFKGMRPASNSYSGDDRKKLTLKNGHGLFVVDTNNIFFIEKTGLKCTVHTNIGIYETSETLAALEKKLGSHMFFRCHRGFLINIYQVEKVSPYADRAYEVKFYNYNRNAFMRREKFEEFVLLVDI